MAIALATRREAALISYKTIEKAARRVTYYIKGVARDFVPQPLYDARLAHVLRGLERDLPEPDVLARVNYYNKLTADAADGFTAGPRPKVRDGSRYYYDLMEARRYFPKSLGLRYLFGDVIHVPDEPTIVKSRPIAGDNRNSVVLKLDRFRHFQLFLDPYPFEAKHPRAVWRGEVGIMPWRQRLVDRHRNTPRCDLGEMPVGNEPIQATSYLSPLGQMRFKYILSIEGNDVATNLKWVMASNSLCLMPAPRYETWFMEGRLVAGYHYVQLRDDYADLDDRIDYYEAHPDEAAAIIANAQAHVRQFSDRKRERLISLLVLQKYFERTGQTEPLPMSARLFA